MNKRLLSKLLALCMAATMLPVSAMAEEAHTTIGTYGEIISFAPFAETEITVAVGTPAEDLELPEKLTVTVRTAVTSEDKSPLDSDRSDEDTSVDDLAAAPIDSGVQEASFRDPGNGDEDTVSYNVAVAPASSATEDSTRDSSNGDEYTEEDSVSVTSGSSIETEGDQTGGAEKVPDPEWEENTVDIPVTWVSTNYDPNTEGDYVFTPVIDDYTVSAELVELPQVTVTVEAAASMMRTLLGSGGSTVIDVNNSAEIGYYIENATGNLELKLISSGFATAYVMTTIPEHIGYDITIDLNGQTMANDNSGTENVIRKIGNGKLTIKDSSSDGSGKISRPEGSGPAILNESTGEVIIEGGSIDSVYASAIVSNNGPVTFKGGKIVNTEGIGIQCDNSTVTIEGGDINSTGNCKTTISANIINVSGGTVQNGSYQGSTLVGNTISVSGGTVKTGTPDGYAIKGNDDATITLTGGTTQNISWSNEGIAINPGTRGTIRIPSGTVTVIGDAMAMLQGPDLSGYSNVVISGNTSGADDTGLVVITLGALEAELDQYKYLLFEPGTGLPKEPMPEATFTATGSGDGTLSGLTAGLKCYIEGRGWYSIDSSANINLSNLEPCIILLVRKGNGTTTADSDTQTITVTKAEKPNLMPTQPDTIGGNGSIPMTSTHEYCTYHNNTWIQASGTTILGPGTYRVRVRAVGTMLASEIQDITLTAFSGTKEPMPEAIFSATGPREGTLSGLTAGLKCYIEGRGWHPVDSSANIPLSNLEPGNILLVRKGNGTTTADSDAQTITVTKAATPTLTATQPGVIGGSGSIPMTSAHEYSTNGGSSWNNASGETILVPGTYRVRIRAAGTVLASEAQIITLTAFTGTKEPMPEATFSATGPYTGILTGVASGMKYRIGSGIMWTDISSSTDINLSSLSACTISVVKKGDGITTSDSDAQTITVTRAATPTLTATQPGVIGGSGSILMTAAHEYSDDGSSWSNASGATTLAAGTYLVRVRASGTMLASEDQIITLAAFTGTKETTPEAAFTATGPDTGILTGVASGMKYRIGSKTWNDISSGTDINLSDLSGCTISVVKKGDGIATRDSDAQTITVTKAAKPTLTATQPGVIGGSGSIPMTAAHEYSADGGSSWSNASGATTLVAGTYRVRVRAAGTMLASDPQEITLTAFTGTKETMPEAAFTATGPDTGILTGVASGMKCRINSGTWTDISSGTDINLSDLSACTISVVKKGDGIATIDSDAQTITVTKAATPTLTATQPGVIGGSGSIPMTAAHEYSADGGSSWNNASGETILVPGTYLVRLRVSGTMLASEPQEITLTAFTGTRESTPTANVDYAAEKLTGLTANGSYLAGAATITAGTSGEIGIDNSWFGTAISLIKKGNGTTTTDSTAQSLSLAARPAAPACTVTQPSASSATGTVSGIGMTMEYSTNGGTDWTIGTGTDISGLSPGTVLIRMKATAGAPAGLSQSITITAYLPNALTGTATINNTSPRIGDRLTGSLVGGNNTGALTYVWKARGTQAGIGSEYIVAAADYGKMITLEISSNVETGTRTSTTTEAVAKKAAPAAPSAPTLSSKTQNSITLTANAAYAFSKDGSTWQTGNVFSGLSASTAYTFYQRVAETADMEASGASPGFSVTTNSNGGGGNGGNTSGNSSSGSGGSSSDNTSPVIVTPPAPDKPNSPTQGEIKVPGTVDSMGNIKMNITDKTVADAFDKALEDAKKNGNEQNGITVVLRVDTGSNTGSNVTVNLPKTVQDIIIEKKIVNIVVVVDKPDIRIDMDLATVQEINRQSKSDVNITATRTDSGKLTGEAKRVIGNRPVFDLKVNYGSGKQVQSFGTGSVSVTIPYTLGANEKAGNVKAVYVDAEGRVHWLVNSVYDSANKVLRFSTDHFSTYGIGYKQTNTAFADIAGHWAKEDIEFVVSRGLFSGTSDTTFSPNTAMTRGMFITALGRLANADVSGYKQSSFTDVKNDAYYMGYIEWASKNSIVNGTDNGKFAPDQSITREQMAVIMQNYAKVIGFTLPKVHMENTFADSGKFSAYARDAVRQTQMAGIFSGKNGNLFDPQGTATRAEASAVLRRFVELANSIDTM